MPNYAQRLELAACTNDLDAARHVASSLGGTLYSDEREEFAHLPFRALTTCVTDELSSLRPAADIGLYVVCRRIIKPGQPRVVGLFPLVHHPELTHEQADAHWREQHAPLTFKHHVAMSHYSQLSVVQRISGPDIDGLALCGFDSVEDLRERFYTEPDSAEIIATDVQKFADTRQSPRRLIANVQDYSEPNSG
ncbi:MAG: EthD domain-containing protein [Pseudomonadales bacterium]